MVFHITQRRIDQKHGKSILGIASHSSSLARDEVEMELLEAPELQCAAVWLSSLLYVLYVPT
jgi:hypothetical protein